MSVCEPRRANSDENGDILEFLLADFIHNEPLNKCLQLTREECVERLTGVVCQCVEAGTSCVVRNMDGEVIACMLNKIVRREEFQDAPGDHSSTSQSENLHGLEVIAELLGNLERNLWEHVPKELSELLYIEIISVSSSYSRRGIGKRMYEWSEREARQRNLKGIFTEATAINSQKMLAGYGFTAVDEVEHCNFLNPNGKQYLNCEDGTTKATLSLKMF